MPQLLELEASQLEHIIEKVREELNTDIDIPDAEILSAVEPHLKASLETLKRELTKELAAQFKKLVPNKITIQVTDSKGKTTKQKDLGTVHKAFAELLAIVKAARASGSTVNIWLCGPAGTGKTTAAAMLAKALDLGFFFNGAIENEHKLLGFVDAHGKIVSRPFRKAYTKGGVYLFDEVDASFPGALLAFNAALANGSCDFPDGNFERHPDCIIIAAANTTGLGATPDYVGRLKQDAAFLDRFCFLDWEIDEALELAIANQYGQADWAKEVQAYRANVIKHGIRNVTISPRATYTGAALLAGGIPKDKVIKYTVRKGCSDETWAKISGKN